MASDPDGNQVICAASPRAYDRDGCACANRQGRIFYGRVEEYPRR